MQSFDSAEIQARHQRLQELMTASSSKLDAIIVLNTADLYHLSGTVQPAQPAPCRHLLVRRAPPRPA